MSYSTHSPQPCMYYSTHWPSHYVYYSTCKRLQHIQLLLTRKHQLRAVEVTTAQERTLCCRISIIFRLPWSLWTCDNVNRAHICPIYMWGCYILDIFGEFQHFKPSFVLSTCTGCLRGGRCCACASIINIRCRLRVATTVEFSKYMYVSGPFRSFY